MSHPGRERLDGPQGVAQLLRDLRKKITIKATLKQNVVSGPAAG